MGNVSKTPTNGSDRRVVPQDGSFDLETEKALSTLCHPRELGLSLGQELAVQEMLDILEGGDSAQIIGLRAMSGAGKSLVLAGLVDMLGDDDIQIIEDPSMLHSVLDSDPHTQKTIIVSLLPHQNLEAYLPKTDRVSHCTHTVSMKGLTVEELKQIVDQKLDDAPVELIHMCHGSGALLRLLIAEYLQDNSRETLSERAVPIIADFIIRNLQDEKGNWSPEGYETLCQQFVPNDYRISHQALFRSNMRSDLWLAQASRVLSEQFIQELWQRYYRIATELDRPGKSIVEPKLTIIARAKDAQQLSELIGITEEFDQSFLGQKKGINCRKTRIALYDGASLRFDRGWSKLCDGYAGKIEALKLPCSLKDLQAEGYLELYTEEHSFESKFFELSALLETRLRAAGIAYQWELASENVSLFTERYDPQDVVETMSPVCRQKIIATLQRELPALHPSEFITAPTLEPLAVSGSHRFFFRVRAEDERSYFLKVLEPHRDLERGGSYTKERVITELARERGVPVAKCFFPKRLSLESELSHEFGAQSIDLQMQSFEPGVPGYSTIANHKLQLKLFESLGANLRKLHQLPVVGFGIHYDHRRGCFEQSWSEYVRRFDIKSELMALEHCGILSDHEVRIIEYMLIPISQRRMDVAAVLTHTDLNPGNYLHNPITGEITSLLDWETAEGAPWQREIAGVIRKIEASSYKVYIPYEERLERRDAFLKGYGLRHGEEDSQALMDAFQVCSIVRFMYFMYISPQGQQLPYDKELYRSTVNNSYSVVDNSQFVADHDFRLGVLSQESILRRLLAQYSSAVPSDDIRIS